MEEKTLEKMLTNHNTNSDLFLEQCHRWIWYVIQTTKDIGFPYQESEDYLSAGTIGILEAAKRYSPDKGSFLEYLKKFIIGAVSTHYYKFVLQTTLYHGRTHRKIVNAEQMLILNGESHTIYDISRVTNLSIKVVKSHYTLPTILSLNEFTNI